MKQIVGLVFFIMGAFMVIKHDYLSSVWRKEQKRLFGFNFDERNEKIARFMFILIGLIFLLIGFLSFLSIIQFK